MSCTRRRIAAFYRVLHFGAGGRGIRHGLFALVLRGRYVFGLPGGLTSVFRDVVAGQVYRRIRTKTDVARCGFIVDLENGFRDIVGIALFAKIGIGVRTARRTFFAGGEAVGSVSGCAALKFFAYDIVGHNCVSFALQACGIV